MTDLVLWHRDVYRSPDEGAGPGGIGDFGLHPNCTGGAVVFVDKTILGFNHIYPFPTCRVATGLALGDGGLYVSAVSVTASVLRGIRLCACMPVSWLLCCVL